MYDMKNDLKNGAGFIIFDSTVSRIRVKYLEPKYSICYFTENGVFPYIDMGKKTKTSNSIKNFPGMFPSTLLFLNF